jgi:phosphate transport system substrate-binding protein
MRIILFSLMVFFIILVSAFLPGNFCLAESLHYQGTHILTYSTMAKLTESFEQITGIHIEVKGGGCADGVVVVVNDRFEMGGLCCPLKQEEIEQNGLVGHPVARDIKTVIVNRKNPLSNISAEQLRAIHQGVTTNWEELGWIDKPIAVVYRKHCLDRQEPVRLFLGLDNRLDNLTSKAITVRTDKELIDYVSQFPTAIGVTSNVFVRDKDVRILDIDNVSPTADNVESNQYQFTAILYIVTKGEPDQDTKRFLEFVRSDVGQAIVKEHLAGIP